jgi:hypothetical protein
MGGPPSKRMDRWTRAELRVGARLSRALRTVGDPATTGQTGGYVVVYASPALGVNTRICRDVRVPVLECWQRERLILAGCWT